MFWLWAHGSHSVCISKSFSYKDTSILGKGPPFSSVNFPNFPAMTPFPSKATFWGQEEWSLRGYYPVKWSYCFSFCAVSTWWGVILRFGKYLFSLCFRTLVLHSKNDSCLKQLLLECLQHYKFQFLSFINFTIKKLFLLSHEFIFKLLIWISTVSVIPVLLYGL